MLERLERLERLLITTVKLYKIYTPHGALQQGQMARLGLDLHSLLTISGPIRLLPVQLEKYAARRPIRGQTPTRVRPGESYLT